MKKKWKVLLVCVVVLAGIAAWCFVPRSAVEEDFKIHYVGDYSSRGYKEVSNHGRHPKNHAI